MADFVLYRTGKTTTIRAAVEERLPGGGLRVTPYFFQDENGADTGPFIGGSVTLSAEDSYTALPSDVPDALKAFIDGVIQDVAELPDRTSPEGQPDMILVTADELRLILTEMAGRSGLAPSALPASIG